jgi:hypothetical protein
MDAGASVHPEGPPSREKRREGMKVNARPGQIGYTEIVNAPISIYTFLK